MLLLVLEAPETVVAEGRDEVEALDNIKLEIDFSNNGQMGWQGAIAAKIPRQASWTIDSEEAGNKKRERRTKTAQRIAAKRELKWRPVANLSDVGGHTLRRSAREKLNVLTYFREHTHGKGNLIPSSRGSVLTSLCFIEVLLMPQISNREISD